MDTARIRCGNGGYLLPATTPYEKEWLFDQAEAAAKRYGEVRVRLRRQQWAIRPAEPREDCGACGYALTALAYRIDGRSLCGRCVRSVLR